MATMRPWRTRYQPAVGNEPGLRLRDEVVDDADVVALAEDAALLDATDDAREAAHAIDVVVDALGVSERSRELDVLVEQRPGRVEVPLLHASRQRLATSFGSRCRCRHEFLRFAESFLGIGAGLGQGPRQKYQALGPRPAL